MLDKFEFFAQNIEFHNFTNDQTNLSALRLFAVMLSNSVRCVFKVKSTIRIKYHFNLLSTQADKVSQNILKIALDVPLDKLFDYLDGGFDVEIGQRVAVSFGWRK
jgi:Primosomal protein N'' (replication factor Y) - superfamily II helicase